MSGSESGRKRQFSLQQEAADFADAVVQLVVPKNANHWKERVERLWTDIQERGLSDRTPSTQKLYMSRFRKAVRDRLAEVEENEARRERVEAGLIEIIRIDPAIMAELNAAYQERVQIANTDLVVFAGYEEYRKECVAMLAHPDPIIKALGVLAVTGRRFQEVVHAGSFAIYEENTSAGTVRHKYVLEFGGQLKTREREGTMFGKSYPIPVLAPADQIVRAVNAIRSSSEGKSWASMSPNLVESTLRLQFNKALKERAEIAKLWPKNSDRAPLTMKSLRPLYAEIAYTVFAPRTTRAPYFARILGHAEDDYTTALSYMVFTLNRDSARAAQDELNQLIMLREQSSAEARSQRDELIEDSQ